jgi:hypothetical protein
MRMSALVVAIGIAFAPTFASAENCGLPNASTQEWPAASPEVVGLASAVLCQMLKWLNVSSFPPALPTYSGMKR